MVRIRRSLVALVAALSVLLSLGATVGDQFFCRMMGRVTVACCCCASHAAAGLARGDCDDRLARGDCCERIEQRAAGVPGAREGAARIPPAPVAFVPACFLPSSPAPASARVAWPVQARAPPALGPPLFLRHCSLLS